MDMSSASSINESLNHIWFNVLTSDKGNVGFLPSYRFRLIYAMVLFNTVELLLVGRIL
jgi:hypothetical protein